MKPPFFTIALVLCAGLLVAGCSRHRAGDEDEDSSAAPPPRVDVHVATVRTGDIPVVVNATGKTDVVRREKVVAPVGGRVISLKVLEYQRVNEGDVLAVIRTRESQAAIDGANALLQSATDDRQRKEAQKSLDLAMNSQSNALVRATINGVVASRSVTEGALVAEGGDLLTIVDPASVYFTADVPLNAVGELRIGQKCSMRFPALGNAAFAGTVDALSPQSDLQTQTVGLRVRFAGESTSSLRPDMAGVVSVVTGVHRKVLLVPRAALLRNDETDTYTLVTVLADSSAKSVNVVRGEHNDSLVEVAADGLRAGTLVVVEGGYAIADSTKLHIVAPAP